MNPETKREKELREKLREVLFYKFGDTTVRSLFDITNTVMDLLKAEGIIGEQE